LNLANQLTGGKDQNIIKALHLLKEKVAKDKEQEKEIVKKMLLTGGLYKEAPTNSANKGANE
jgi:hypothetical protein